MYHTLVVNLGTRPLGELTLQMVTNSFQNVCATLQYKLQNE